ncbi:MAG: hypothetical protein ACRDZ3_19960 [Acidimicrobiia bacterium]
MSNDFTLLPGSGALVAAGQTAVHQGRVLPVVGYTQPDADGRCKPLVAIDGLPVVADGVTQDR